LKKIKGFSKYLGMPVTEKEIMALFTSIEASLFKGAVSCGSPSSTYKLTPKSCNGSRELKRLDCSISYASRDIVSNMEVDMGEYFLFPHEAKNHVVE
jgi:hypothetical protein